MPLNNIEQEVRKEFQEKFPIYPHKMLYHACIEDKHTRTMLKSFLSTALSKAYEEGKREGEEEIFWRGYEKGVEIQIPKKYLSDEEVNETLSNY